MTRQFTHGPGFVARQVHEAAYKPHSDQLMLPMVLTVGGPAVRHRALRRQEKQAAYQWDMIEDALAGW